MLQLVKSLPFPIIPELSKRYPFLAEPSNLVTRAFPLKNGWHHPFFEGKALGTTLGAFPYSLLYGVFPPSPPLSGCTPSSPNHIKSVDNSTATAVIFLNKVALEKPRHLDTSVVVLQSKSRHRHTEIRFCCFKSLKNRLSYWASTSVVVGWQSKPRQRHTKIRFCCFKSLKNRLSYWTSTSAIKII